MVYDKPLVCEYNWVIGSCYGAMCAVVAARAEVFWNVSVKGFQPLPRVRPEVVHEIHPYFEGLETAVVKWSRSFMMGPLKANVGSLDFTKFYYCSKSFGLVAAVRFERL